MTKIMGVMDPVSAVRRVLLHLAATRQGCDWPLWADDAAPTHVYCGAPVKTVVHADGQVSRLSWCAGHAGRVTTTRAAA